MAVSKKTTQAELRADYLAWTTEPDRCALCWIPGRRLSLRFKATLEMAHIISRARGGHAGNTAGNVLFLCSSCHGAQHNSNYTYADEVWPDVLTGHLFRAKLELGELSIHELASISGYTPRYILDLTRISWPTKITTERLRWGK